MQSRKLFTFKCGCILLGETDEYEGEIGFCRLHKAAPDLLEALQATDLWLSNAVSCLPNGNDLWNQVRAAIAKTVPMKRHTRSKPKPLPKKRSTP